MNHQMKAAAWSAVCIGLVACSAGEPQSASPVVPAAPAAATATAAAGEYVAAAPLGTPSPSLHVGFILPDRPLAGQLATVKLSVVSDDALQRLALEASSAGLVVEPATATAAVEPVASGENYPLEVSFTPRRPGITDLVLLVHATTENGEQQSRFAVPVLVEAPPAGAGG
jgi:hypothetical protein